jgi:hypothetical protein
VKRISRQASDLELEVRILWGAHKKYIKYFIKMKNKTFLLFFGLLFLPFLFVSADGLVPCEMGSCTICDLFQLFTNIVTFVLTFIVPPAATVMFIWAGVVFYTSGGVPEKVNKAKSIMTYAVLGLIIIYSAWVIVGAFLNAIGVASWTGLGTWWEIECNITDDES